MTWNNQIIFHDKDKEPWYGLHEVFRDGEKILNYTEEAIDFVCDEDETEQGIIKSLELALRDVQKWPVLIESEIVLEEDPIEL